MPEIDNTAQPKTRGFAAQVGLFAFGYFLITAVPLVLAGGDIQGVPVMPALGLLLGVLLRTERRTWPVWVLLTIPLLFASGFVAGQPVMATVTIAVGDSICAPLGAWLIERFCGRPFKLDSLRSLSALIWFGSVLAPLPAALAGGAVIYFGLGFPFSQAAVNVWSFMLLSIVLVTPVVLLWRRGWPVEWLHSKRRWEFLGLVFVAIGLPTAIFLMPHWPILSMVMPPLIWAAIRFGPMEAAAANLVLGIVACSVAISGSGWVFDTAFTPIASLFYIQTFLAFMAIGPSLVVALALVERRESGHALQRDEARLHALLDHSPTAITVRDFSGRYLLVNRTFREWYGDVDFSRMLVGMTDIFPAAVTNEMSAQTEKIRANKTAIESEFEIVRKDGSVHRVAVINFPILDKQGDVIAVGGIGYDVTDAKRSEQQLRQAQKMEAVGQLTGGIAHDFNNLLAVIIGNLELALETLPESDNNATRAQSALRAAERGAALTQRLLAFSRKQALSPEVIDLNQTIREMQTLLQRTLGEQIAIEFVTAAGLWRCEADPAQVESALLNLAINARDAMPTGGRLTIETANVRLDDDYASAQLDLKPGQYVMIGVGDTGEGMPLEVSARAFDPFFTTKAAGRGSGLGLAMVHGFVKQSGGHVAIYSEVGQGTSVKIYLPRTHAEGETPALPLDPADEPLGRQERVLVVEDDPDVRTLAVALLSDLGYQVSEARDGETALALVKRDGHFDLLLSDVVLSGGMTGRQVAEALCEIIPGLSVLYMSGYTANAVVHHGRLDPGVTLLHKPFRKIDLARAVRKVLDGGA